LLWRQWSPRSFPARFAALAFVAIVAGGCGGHRSSGADWASPNGDLAGTRSAASSLDSSNVGSLRVLWRFHLTSGTTFSGRVAATPLVVGDRVYVQDLDSNVDALDRATGKLVWRHRFASPTGGPNGVTYANGRLFGNTNVGVFALDAKTGQLVWKRDLTTAGAPMTGAPLVDSGLVVSSNTADTPGGRGLIVALDADSGSVRWRFDTIAKPWVHPGLAAGGGAWQTATVDGSGHLWVGTANPDPWGGSTVYPNGGMYPGAVRWTDSLLELDLKSGRLLFADQVTPHDVRDYDFQDPPVQAGSLVVGAGKAGRVIAWDRSSRRRVWSTAVGLHRNDTGPLPARPTSVCPGLLGGVETPLAVSDGRVFVPVVDLCFSESALGTSLAGFLTTNYAKGRGAIAALDLKTGRPLWVRRFGSPVFGCATAANDVVFTVTYVGTVVALRADDGDVLWRATAPAAVNACPAVAGSLLVVAAGAAYPEPRAASDEVVAYAPPS
jgi:outer membrane protein assembly factor BamB